MEYIPIRLVYQMVTMATMQNDESNYAVADMVSCWNSFADNQYNGPFGPDRLIELAMYSYHIGYRKTPVTIGGLLTGENPQNIERALDNICRAFNEGNITPEEWYYHFEKIHPFEDYNGRIGWLIWGELVKQRTKEETYGFPPKFEELARKYS